MGIWHWTPHFGNETNFSAWNSNFSLGRRPGPEVIKLFSYSTQLSMNFFLLINIKMPSIVGILIFISRINFMLSSVVQEESFNGWYLIFSRQKKFHSQLSWAWKFFYNLRAWTPVFKIWMRALIDTWYSVP